MGVKTCFGATICPPGGVVDNFLPLGHAMPAAILPKLRNSGALRWLSPRSMQEQALAASEKDENEGFGMRSFGTDTTLTIQTLFLTDGLWGTVLLYRERSATRWREPSKTADMATDAGGGFCSPREQNATEWSLGVQKIPNPPMHSPLALREIAAPFLPI